MDQLEKRIGVVGLGHAGFFNIRGAEANGLEVVAASGTKITDPMGEAENPQTIGVQHFNIFQDIPYEDLDAVVIASPNRDHYENSLYFLLRSVPVIVEKPAVQTLDEFDHLSSMAETYNTSLISAYHAAHAPEVEWFVKQKENIESEHGPITGFHSMFFDPYLRGGVNTSVYENESTHSLQDSWLDSGPNALSVLLQLLPDLTFEEGFLTQAKPTYTTDFEATLSRAYPVTGVMHFADSQAQGTIHTSWAYRQNRKETRLVMGRSGNEILLDHSGQQVVLNDRTDERQVLFSESGDRLANHYRNMWSHINQHLEEGNDNQKFSRRVLDLTLEGRYESHSVAGETQPRPKSSWEHVAKR